MIFAGNTLATNLTRILNSSVKREYNGWVDNIQDQAIPLIYLRICENTPPVAS